MTLFRTTNRQVTGNNVFSPLLVAPATPALEKKESVPTIFPTFPTFPSDSRVGSNPKRFGVTSSLVFPLDENFPVLEADLLVLESNGLMFQGPRIFHRFQVQC